MKDATGNSRPVTNDLNDELENIYLHDIHFRHLKLPFGSCLETLDLPEKRLGKTELAIVLALLNTNWGPSANTRFKRGSPDSISQCFLITCFI
ncbi:hypothetical protein FKM82_003073 [Ascaphus truei]